jgi:DNA-binding SARP family transcriptional activator
MLQFRVLGTVEAGADGNLLPLGGKKQRALLAYLLLNRNRSLAREALIDVLWPDDPPATATHALDVYVSRLRKTLGSDGLIEARGGAVRMTIDDESLDVARFERLMAQAREAAEPRDRLAVLDQALVLWRGHALADLLDEEFAHAESERLDEVRVAAVEERLETLLELGRHDEAIPQLQLLVAEEPLRERPRRLLMLALYRAGRQGDALSLYRETRRFLHDELGLEPSRELRELEAAILRQDPTLAPAAPSGERDGRRAARRRRRVALIAAGATVAIAAAVVAAVLSHGGSHHSRPLVVPDLAAIALEPRSGRVTSIIPLRGQPIAAVAEGDTVWIANSSDRTLTRIEDRGEAPAVTTAGLPAQPVAIAFGAGKLWVASLERSHSLTAVDPLSGEIDFSIPLHEPGLGQFSDSGWGANGVAFGNGSVWATVGVSGLMRLDTKGRLLGNYVIGPTPTSLTVGDDGNVWVALIGPAEIAEFDALHGIKGPVVPVGDMASGEVATALACTIGDSGDSVWVPAYGGSDPIGAVWRIEARRASVVNVVQTGGSPCEVAFGDGRVWVTNPNAQELDEIDPASAAIVRRIALTAPPAAIAVTSHHVWITTN